MIAISVLANLKKGTVTMASSIHHIYSTLFVFVTFFSFIITCSMAQGGTTVATWYGDSNGAGTDGMYTCVCVKESACYIIFESIEPRHFVRKN